MICESGKEEPTVTAAMIQAGVIALCSFDSEFESREEGAERIFRAMFRLLPLEENVERLPGLGMGDK